MLKTAIVEIDNIEKDAVNMSIYGEAPGNKQSGLNFHTHEVIADGSSGGCSTNASGWHSEVFEESKTKLNNFN
jgi:hypothetical protein